MALIRLVEHDGGSPRSLAVRLEDALDEGTVGLIVDLGDHVADSVLLHLVVVTDKALIARGGRAVLLCELNSGRAALQATGLDAQLPIAESVYQAMELVTEYLSRS